MDVRERDGEGGRQHDLGAHAHRDAQVILSRHTGRRAGMGDKDISVSKPSIMYGNSGQVWTERLYSPVFLLLWAA